MKRGQLTPIPLRQAIHERVNDGNSKSAVARELQLARNTVIKYSRKRV